MRPLPIVVAQAPARDPSSATRDLREEVRGLCADFPDTRLVVYPEYHTCRVRGDPHDRRRSYEGLAEPLDGPRVQELCALAKEAGVWLLPGTIIERGPRGELFNTAVLCSPDGDLAGSYRKAFPWRPFEPFDPGDEFTVVDLPGIGRIGLAICYDLWFPEVARSLAWMGADLLVYPAQTSTCDREQELVLARAAAIANQVFVLSVNAAAPDGTGRSLVVDPEGLVRVQAPSETATVLTDVVDVDSVERVRTHGTCGLNRLWSQVRPGDPPLPLPVYGGAITPERWHRATGAGRRE